MMEVRHSSLHVPAGEVAWGLSVATVSSQFEVELRAWHLNQTVPVGVIDPRLFRVLSRWAAHEGKPDCTYSLEASLG